MLGGDQHHSGTELSGMDVFAQRLVAVFEAGPQEQFCVFRNHVGNVRLARLVQGLT
jgi:hypothetical protein